MPFLLQISDSLRNTYVTEEEYCPDIENFQAANKTVWCEHSREFYSMQYALVINIAVVFLGAVCFFVSAIYIVKDKERVERFVAGNK